MRIKEVAMKYHLKVPFPISVKKVRDAGYEPKSYILKMIKEIKQCEDFEIEKQRSANLRKLLKAVDNLKRTIAAGKLIKDARR